MEPIEKTNENEVENCDVVDEKTLKMESDILPFLKGLKLEEYYEVMVNNGGDKLGQLIYVDENTIDAFCREINMKVIHSGVFKKAIRECKNSNRVNNFEPDRQHKPEPPPMHPFHPQYLHPSYQESQFQVFDRRRILLGLEPAYHHPSPHTPMVVPHPPEQISFFRKNTPNQDFIPRPMLPLEELKNELDRTNYDNGTQLSKNSSEQPPSFNETLPDGSYLVCIQEKMIKFPACVRKLTVIDRIDAERMDVIRKGAQIYGRDDTKRKNNELTLLEQFMNEIAFEICLRDFTYMISRQKLLGLVREIVKDNQVQFSINHPNANISQTSVKRSERIKYPLNNFPIETCSPPTITQSEAPKNYSMPGMSDYDVILYHKKHREWPQGISKEYRKYLGRRSSNFDLIDGALYYNKDHKKRRWIDTQEEIKNAFTEGHVNADTNCHYSKEATSERINMIYYFKNMNNQITDLFLQCQSCQEKYKFTADEYQKRKSSRISNNIEEFHVISVLPTEINPDIPVEDNEPDQIASMIPLNPIIEEPPAKKPRKSIPKKLESQEFNILMGRSSILKKGNKESESNKVDASDNSYMQPEFHSPDLHNSAVPDVNIEVPHECNIEEIHT